MTDLRIVSTPEHHEPSPSIAYRVGAAFGFLVFVLLLILAVLLLVAAIVSAWRVIA